ncbi:MAG: hypothetical protein HQ564_10460 [Candidatus Saganbacteria bacterium]|nr:hypothetical protein [Candidatus Saganbacteria bacterium]
MSIIIQRARQIYSQKPPRARVQIAKEEMKYVAEKLGIPEDKQSLPSLELPNLKNAFSFLFSLPLLAILSAGTTTTTFSLPLLFNSTPTLSTQIITGISCFSTAIIAGTYAYLRPPLGKAGYYGKMWGGPSIILYQKKLVYAEGRVALRKLKETIAHEYCHHLKDVGLIKRDFFIAEASSFFREHEISPLPLSNEDKEMDDLLCRNSIFLRGAKYIKDANYNTTPQEIRIGLFDRICLLIRKERNRFYDMGEFIGGMAAGLSEKHGSNDVGWKFIALVGSGVDPMLARSMVP